ncbi:sirohydrochlorin cobaltochelatase [Pelosinus sp. sgz500959]|uniref:sirohydrochlorin cobaltochelatase n=1 Tax=Pelosinus sp. sgz500959 TaxID=3242472 RepID=UPI00366AC153
MSKKAVLVVSFGTVYVDTLEKTIGSTEERFKVAFPEYEIRRAFTSSTVIEKLAEKHGVQVDGVATALEKLATEEYEEVYIQPLYIVADKTYHHIKEYVSKLAHSKEKTFKKITMGRPLLLSVGIKNHPDDYAIAIEAIKTQLPELSSEKAVVFMCNGSQQLEYSVLQLKLSDAGLKNAFVYTAEGYPTLEGVIKQLQDNQVKEVILVPFLFVASEHVIDYIGGDKEDSPKSQLEAKGFTVSVYTKGLGENPAIQGIFAQHLKDVLKAIEMHHGHHKKTAHGEQKGTHHSQ